MANAVALHVTRHSRVSVPRSSADDRSDNREHVTSAHLLDDDITQHELDAALGRLRHSSSPGSDDIAPFMLLDGGAAMRDSLLLLVRLSWRYGLTPTRWRMANVLPINKKTRPTEPSHLRPISLLSVVAKLSERVVHARLSTLAASNDWIPEYQFGFRKNRSAVDVLVDMTQRAHTTFTRSECMVPVSLDVASAFDSVQHACVRQRLRQLGISGRLYDWICQFLQRRWIRVLWNEASSDWHETTAGTAQGLSISPPIFSLFASPLLTEVDRDSSVTPRMFADDVTLAASAQTPSLAAARLNNAILAVEQRCASLRLRLNAVKSHAIVLARRRKAAWTDPELVVGGKRIAVSGTMKLNRCHTRLSHHVCCTRRRHRITRALSVHSA